MGLFKSFLKKKKSTQSEIMLKNDERSFSSPPTEDKDNKVNNDFDTFDMDNNNVDIMERLKGVDFSSVDPRTPYSEIWNVNEKSSTTNTIPHALSSQEAQLPDKIERDFHNFNENQSSTVNRNNIEWEQLWEELRTIRAQNDLILELLKKIEKKMFM